MVSSLAVAGPTSRRLYPVVLAFLFSSACSPPPHATLTITDLSGAAADATHVAVGEELDALTEIQLRPAGLPATVTVTAPKGDTTRLLWVEARDAASVPLARGLTEVPFPTNERGQAAVDLLAVCAATNDGARCALPELSRRGECFANRCELPVSLSASSVAVSPTSAVLADGTQTATITVTVRDEDGVALADRQVTVAASGSENVLAQAASVSGTDGTVTATLASTRVETKVVDAIVATSDGPQRILETPSVSFVGGIPDGGTSTLTAHPAVNIAADGIERSLITVIVRDAQGNPLSGVEVGLELEGEAATLIQPSLPTDSNGLTTGSVTATVEGDKRIRAIINPLGAALRVDAISIVRFSSPVPAASGAEVIDTDREAGCFGVRFKLYQARGRKVDVELQVGSDPRLGSRTSTAGGPSRPAGLRGLETSPTFPGKEHTILWSAMDHASNAAGDGLVLTLTPVLGELRGTSISAIIFPNNALHMQKRQTYTMGGTLWSLDVGDLDDDGVPDLVTSEAPGELHLWSGRVNGFSPSGADPIDVRPAVGDPAVAHIHTVTLADVNDDAYLDIVAGVRSADNSSAIVVYPNDAAGGWQAAIVTPIATAAVVGLLERRDYLVTADIDHDGHNDLVGSWATDDFAAVLRGDGLGGFTVENLPTVVGDEPNRVTVADADGDGNLDIALLNRGAATIAIYDGDGTGGFIRRAAALPVGVNPGDITFADVQDDALPEILAVNGADGLHVYANDGAAGFAAPAVTRSESNPPSVVAAGNLRGDPSLETVLGVGWSNLEVRYKNQAGQPATVHFGSGGSWNAGRVVVRDLNGDGFDDVVIGALDSSLAAFYVWYSASAQRCDTGPVGDTFIGPVTDAVQIAFAELDGNGQLDLVALDADGPSVVTSLGHGDGTFAPATRHDLCLGLDPCGGPVAMAVADISGDTVTDVVVAMADSNTLVILEGEEGGFSAPRKFADVTRACALAHSDFDADGFADLVVGRTDDGTGTGSVDFYWGNTDGVARAGPSFAVGPQSCLLRVSDVTADGLVDLVVVDSSSSELRTIVGDRTRNLLMSAAQAVAGGPIDFDLAPVLAEPPVADSPVDMLLVSSVDEAVHIYAGDGAGSFTLNETLNNATGTPPSLVRIGSRQGAQPFIFVAHPGKPTQVHIWYVNLTSTAIVPFPTLMNADALASVDINDDGTADVALVAGGRLRTVMGYTSSGGPGMALLTGARRDVAAPVVAMASADAGRDGHLDLVAVHGAAGNFSVLKNRRIGGCDVYVDPFELLPFSAPYPAYGVATGNLDHDGGADVVLTHRDDDMVSVFFSADQGEWTASSFDAAPLLLALPAGSAPTAAAVARFDADVTPDVVIGSAAALHVFSGAGGRALAEPSVALALSPGFDIAALVAIDATRDGIDDLFVADTATGQLAWIAGHRDGPASAATPVYMALASAASAMVVTDLNRDQVVDVAISDPTARTIVIAHGERLTRDWQTIDSMSLPCIGVPTAIDAADLTADGLIDLVVTERDPDSARIWRQDAAGNFTLQTTLQTPPGPTAVIAGTLAKSETQHIAIAGAGAGDAVLFYFDSTFKPYCSVCGAGRGLSGSGVALAALFAWMRRRKRRE